MGLCR